MGERNARVPSTRRSTPNVRRNGFSVIASDARNAMLSYAERVMSDPRGELRLSKRGVVSFEYRCNQRSAPAAEIGGRTAAAKVPTAHDWQIILYRLSAHHCTENSFGVTSRRPVIPRLASLLRSRWRACASAPQACQVLQRGTRCLLGVRYSESRRRAQDTAAPNSISTSCSDAATLPMPPRDELIRCRPCLIMKSDLTFSLAALVIIVNFRISRIARALFW